jgi:hypothetical protein
MIKNIFNLWNKKTSKNQSDNNSLSFVLDKNDPYIKIIISDTSDSDILSFANMLYELHNGAYINSIIKILMDMGKNDKNILVFTKGVVLEWTKLYKGNLLGNNLTNSTDDEPLVKPTHFYKVSTNE